MSAKLIGANFCAIVQICLCSGLAAQRDGLHSVHCRPAAELLPSGTLEYSWWPDATGEIVAQSVVTGVSKPADVFAWVDGDEHCHYLVSGSTNGDGILEHWYWNVDLSSAATLQGTLTAPSTDFLSVAYHEIEGLFVVVGDGAILQAAWDGNNSPPSLTELVLSVVDLSELLEPESILLRTRDGDPGGLEVVIVERQRDLTFADWYVPDPFTILQYAGSYPASFVRVAPTAPNLTPVQLHWKDVVEGASLVELFVPYSNFVRSYSLYHVESQSAIGTVTVPVETNYAYVSLTQLLQIGHHYLAFEVGAPADLRYAVECHARYGSSETSASGIEIGRLLTTRTVATDVPGYRIASSLHGGEGLATLTEPFEIPAIVSVALRIPGLPDPVIHLPLGSPIGSPGNYLLDAPVTIGARAFASSSGISALLSDQISVPSDPSVVGAVVLHQAIIADQFLYLSDVMGVQVKAGAQSAQAAMTGPNLSGAAMFSAINGALIPDRTVIGACALQRCAGHLVPQ